MVRTPALEHINRCLVELADTGETRLLVAVSPQEGKSTLCSKWYPLWRLIDDPDRRIAIVSYSDEMARRWGSDIKQLVESFDGTDGTIDLGIRLRGDSRAAGRWQVDKHAGGVYCVGISGALTGKPVDDLCIDDPIKDLAAAQSEAYRKRCVDFWQGVAVPRLGPGAKCLLIQTRWHESDMAGWLLTADGEGDQTKGGRWKVVSIPAQADSADDPLGRPIGEFMVSARGDRDWAAIKKSVGPYVWAALYQQRPAPAEGGLFKRLWWRYWHPAPKHYGERIDCGGRIWPLKECWRFATADLAASTRTTADWTVFIAWAITLDGDIVALDMVRQQVGEGGHYDLVRPLVERWQLDTVFVERSQYGTTLAADATRGGVPLSPLTADVDKLTRALPASAKAAAGRIWLPADAFWLQIFLDETASFPNGRHDDICDNVGYAARVAVAEWTPPPPKPAPKLTGEIDFMTVPM
jgi:predicted phage terminase large subunit-like protein